MTGTVVVWLNHRNRSSYRWVLITFNFAQILFKRILIHHSPVVQSIVSLTSSLRVISLTVLADSIYNILIFFAEKMWVAFASYSHFFSKKFQHICVPLDVNFNESLTNDVELTMSLALNNWTHIFNPWPGLQTGGVFSWIFFFFYPISWKIQQTTNWQYFP